MKTLVIVDMQTGFDTAWCKRTRANVARLAKFFKANNWPIVVLEYRFFGDTHEDIKREIDGYQNVRYEHKNRDDGSYEVLDCVRREKWPQESFVVCGVNTNACVRETCEGLAIKLPKTSIRVVKRACNGTRPWDSVKHWIPHYPQIKALV